MEIAPIQKKVLHSTASRFNRNYQLLTTYDHRHIGDTTGTCSEVIYDCGCSGVLSKRPQLAQMKADANLSILTTEEVKEKIRLK